MSNTESELALDAMVQQTWKRVRTAQEIGEFLTRREAMLGAFDSEGSSREDFALAA